MATAVAFNWTYPPFAIDGDDAISVGNGANAITGGLGDDVIFAGLGQNQIDTGDGNDTINDIMERPTIEFDSSRDVMEGDDLEVIVWLTLPTDHDVTATLIVTAEAGTSAAARWAQTQVPVLVPAGQDVVVVPIATIDNELLDGLNVSTVSLVNVSGAELPNEISSPAYVWDNDDGIVLDWAEQRG